MFLSVGAYAQVTTSSLGGRITDETGAPAVSVTVVATRAFRNHVCRRNQHRWSLYRSGYAYRRPLQSEISYVGYKTMNFTDIPFNRRSLQLEYWPSGRSGSTGRYCDSGFCFFCLCRKSLALHKYLQPEYPGTANNQQEYYRRNKLSPYGGNGMSFAGGDGRSSTLPLTEPTSTTTLVWAPVCPVAEPDFHWCHWRVQVVIAPFDVRQTNFIGGGVKCNYKIRYQHFKRKCLCLSS